MKRYGVEIFGYFVYNDFTCKVVYKKFLYFISKFAITFLNFQNGAKSSQTKHNQNLLN